MSTLSRREFIKLSALTSSVFAVPSILSSCSSLSPGTPPTYLDNYASEYEKSPREAAIEWFRSAHFGLFIHYGLYSLLGKGEWVQDHQKIHVAEYEKLMKRFTADKFDADFITDLALAADMKYINITTRHHDSFCLFNTKTTYFNSVNSPAKRDLVGELAEQCAKKKLGLCLYYSHGRDWRHPDAPNNDKWGGKARPLYDEKEPMYHYGAEHDLNRYIDYMHAQLTELLTNYGPIASIWLDGYGVPVSGDIKKFRIPETYKLIRKLQSQCLITSKWGYNGDEDYYSPEYHWLERDPAKTKAMVASGKPIELCTPIAGWGYRKAKDGKHRGANSVWENILYAAKYKANLLLNIGPRGDGSVDPQDIHTLRELGKRIRKEGWPVA